MRVSKKRNLRYFRIFEKIHEDPFISVLDISLSTGMSRNTVSKYLKDMYEKGIILGPQAQMKPCPNYREYVYLLNFEDPFSVFNGLRTFPHIIHHVLTFGNWNTLVVTDRLMDFSQLVGFQEVFHWGEKGCSFTPRVEYVSWDKSFEKVHQAIEEFIPGKPEKDRRLAPFLDWGEDEWKLFHTFQYNLRKRVTPTLKKVKVGYELYTKWKETLRDHCTILTGFYPGGNASYVVYFFLLDSDHESMVRSLFSSFPVTSYFLEVGTQLLVAAAASSDVLRGNLLTL